MGLVVAEWNEDMRHNMEMAQVAVEKEDSHMKAMMAKTHFGGHGINDRDMYAAKIRFNTRGMVSNSGGRGLCSLRPYLR